MNRIPFIEGAKVNLCSAIAEDFGATMQAWINDQEVTHFLSRGTLPADPVALEAEFKALGGPNADLQLAIIEKLSGRYIGITGLHSINLISRHAEFRILIGEKSMWGKAFGAEACQLILAHGFEVLNLNKIWLGVNTENNKAFSSYERCGFKHEGTLRHELFRNSRYYNVARMSLLKDEYLQIKKDWIAYEWIKKQYSA